MEIAPTIQALSLHQNANVTLLITGVGLLASTFAITKEVMLHRPDLLLQAGVAGSLQPEERLAEVVAIKSEMVGDLGVWQNGNFQSLFDLHLLSNDSLPWQDRKLSNHYDLLTAAGVETRDAVTVNEISTTEDSIQYYRNQLQAQVESMEGAALHYVGLSENIPFLQLRAISNYVGERDKSKWQMKEAIAKLNIDLQRLLQNLNVV